MKKNSSILIIYNARLVDSKMDGNGTIIIAEGKIRGITLGECKSAKNALLLAQAFLTESEFESAPELYDAKGLTLMPSFIDMHVHFRYPGQTQKEDLDSGLHAAVAGGYGTVVLMPNTNPVISDRELARKVMEEANSKNLARVFQTVSITKNFEGKDTSGLDSLTNDEFPVITEDGHDVDSAAVMLEGMKKAGEKNIIVSCHCEDPSLAQAARPYRQRALGFMEQYGIPAGKVNVETPNVPASVNFEIDGNLTKANSILALAEDTATLRNIEIAKSAGCHIHICHCSTKISMDAVRRAKEEISWGNTPHGFDCTVEVTPHHLGLVGTDAPNIRALVNPPLRSEDDRRAIIEALRDGTVDAIATDHAPHTQEDKAKGAPGFTGIETAFAVCNTILVKKEDFSLSKLSRLMSANPARLLRINAGRLKVGYNADLVLVNPDEDWIVNSENFASKGKSTPLEGKQLTGKVHATFFGGKKVF
ncbi:dihydroorotase [Treponema sp.]|uniref:dihydroorotase n=1 Tax=Treponema sp. TaxID=166 RepID=UPI0025D5436E|nr:dihydroorotase [Treponema sp.]MBR4323502.1 dihydroorotase [Treponema sp.]